MLLELKDVSKEYEIGVKVLENVSFSVEKGEFVSIIGSSGSGKSTLLRSINRMIDITSGEILFEGTHIEKLKRKEINKFSVFLTQKDAGINLQATDELHYIELDDRTKKMYNHLQKNKIIKFYDVNNEVIELICDSTMKLRTSLHSLEGGTVKMNDKYYEVGNLEKIN